MENLKPCIVHPCPEFATYKGRCEEHQFPAFMHNNRASRLPKDWPHRRKYRLMKDNWICYKCGGIANEVDHIVRGDNHDMDNLASICTDCHKKKTAQEGNDAQWGKNRHEPKIDMWQQEYMRLEELKKREEEQ